MVEVEVEVEAACEQDEEPAGGLVGLFSDVVRLQIELWNAVDRQLREDHDLPVGRFEALSVIAGHPRCRAQDVASTMVITVGGASKLVDRLEEQGYCRRLPNPDDARSRHLQLTPSGRRVLQQARRTVEQVLRQQLGGPLTAEQLRALGDAVAAARTAMTASQGGTGT